MSYAEIEESLGSNDLVLKGKLSVDKIPIRLTSTKQTNDCSELYIFDKDASSIDSLTRMVCLVLSDLRILSMYFGEENPFSVR